MKIYIHDDVEPTSHLDVHIQQLQHLASDLLIYMIILDQQHTDPAQICTNWW